MFIEEYWKLIIGITLGLSLLIFGSPGYVVSTVPQAGQTGYHQRMRMKRLLQLLYMTKMMKREMLTWHLRVKNYVPNVVLAN